MTAISFFCRMCTLAAALGAMPAARAGELRVGKAVVDITPPPGTPMLTPMTRPSVKLAEPAHDPLCVRAIVLECDGHKAAIAACDLTSIPNPMFTRAKELISAATGIDPGSVMISATHTHTAPQVRPNLLGKVDEAAKAKSLAYIESLPDRMAEAVIQAHAALQPAAVSAGIGHENTVSFNRRFMMKDGSVMTNPGKDNPALHEQILRPAGPIDPEVGVVYFESSGHQPLATLVNFALHLDTDGGAAPTADFAATIHKTLADSKGSDMLSLFAIGAAGNINHYDLLNPKGPLRNKSHAESARIGAALAAEVLRTYPRLEPLTANRLRTAVETVTIELPREKGLALAAQHGNAETFNDGEVTVTNKGGRQTFEAQVMAIALGSELAWVGFPGEMFTEFGLALKTASPFKYTMIHELANTSIGYIPNLRAYPEGGYEATYTRCAAGTGEMLVDTATRLLVRLKNDRSDNPPLEPGFVSLFDGKTMSGWRPHLGVPKAHIGGKWIVKDGLLVGDQDEREGGGFLITEGKYKSFILRFDLQQDYPTDTGIFVRMGEDGKSHQITLDNRPEGQIGSIYLPWTQSRVMENPEGYRLFRQGEWNQAELRVEGEPSRIRFWLNGNLVTDFQHTAETTKNVPAEGYIGLQIHPKTPGITHWKAGNTVRYRNLRIRSLP